MCFSPLGEDSAEYSDCIDCEMITDVRDANFDRNDRNLFIVEDCDIKSMNKEQRSIKYQNFSDLNVVILKLIV